MINKKYKKINSYINKINSEILGTKDDIYYIANATLTRNSFATKILSTEKDISSIKNNIVVLFIKYYLKAFVLLLIYFFKIIIYKLFREKNSIKGEILIDTYLLVDKVVKKSSFQDNYFIGLNTLLEKSKYTYLIKSFYGSNLDLKKFYKVIKSLNKSNKNIISEFDFINILDFFKIFIFIIKYPFKIKKIYTAYSSQNRVFDFSLINSLNGSDFNSYIRYLIGKRVANINKLEKIISWCEYQNIDKSFYKGINENSKNITIYGCQFLIPYDSWLNFFIPKSEKKFNLTPTTILTNGKYYLKFIEIDKKLGVSLRYKHIFNQRNSLSKNSDYILLLGSFIKDDTRKLIEYVKKADLDANIILRLHPTDNFNNYKKNIDPNWILSKNSSLNKDINKSFLIITNDATGTSLETVCSEKSTIIVINKNKFSSIPLIDYGKGKIWDIALNRDDIKKSYNKLLRYREKNRKEIEDIALWYKSNFFIEPTKENIIKAFKLENNI